MLTYNNKIAKEVYYGGTRIAEVWAGSKRIFGKPFKQISNNTNQSAIWYNDCIYSFDPSNKTFPPIAVWTGISDSVAYVDYDLNSDGTLINKKECAIALQNGKLYTLIDGAFGEYSSAGSGWTKLFGAHMLVTTAILPNEQGNPIYHKEGLFICGIRDGKCCVVTPTGILYLGYASKVAMIPLEWAGFAVGIFVLRPDGSLAYAFISRPDYVWNIASITDIAYGVTDMQSGTFSDAVMAVRNNIELLRIKIDGVTTLYAEPESNIVLSGVEAHFIINGRICHAEGSEIQEYTLGDGFLMVTDTLALKNGHVYPFSWQNTTDYHFPEPSNIVAINGAVALTADGLLYQKTYHGNWVKRNLEV